MRLSKVIESLVDYSQSAFIKNHCIMGNNATIKKLVYSVQKHKLGGNMLKVDFAKAFNIIGWNFPLELLSTRGFGSCWMGWIKSILYSKASIIFNRAQSRYIRYQRRLRQGDPFSSLLFVLATDVLSCLKREHPIWSPVRKFKKMCHL